MMPTENWRKKMINAVEKIDPDLSPEALELFRNDAESLRQFVGSRDFHEILLNRQDSLSLGFEEFFTVLMEQLLGRLRRDEEFRNYFLEVLARVSDRGWTYERTIEFLEDDDLLAYLVSTMIRFGDRKQVYSLPGEDREYRYIVDLIKLSVESSQSRSYRIYCHIGNYSLFLTGLFPGWIRHRHEVKNRPMDVESYCQYGRTYFGRAAEHDLAEKQRTRPVLRKLSRGYDLVRSSLIFVFRELLPAYR